ncbi:MAG: hypothetical protein KatS3mg061_1297 [Dehalococcoidia bacterium]|nr:MAG: hypothetical protein KatS3mg061_1297 [Dehalococcoidia bacterium]
MEVAVKAAGYHGGAADGRRPQATEQLEVAPERGHCREHPARSGIVVAEVEADNGLPPPLATLPVQGSAIAGGASAAGSGEQLRDGRQGDAPYQ